MEDLAVNKYRKAAAFLRNTVLENLRNYAYAKYAGIMSAIIMEF